MAVDDVYKETEAKMNKAMEATRSDGHVRLTAVPVQ